MLRKVLLQIAVIGGSYDPPHLRHFCILRRICSVKWLNKIIVVPAMRNPQKAWSPMFSFQERVMMLQETIDYFGIYFDMQTRIEVIEIAKDLPSPSYMIDVLDHLAARFNAVYWPCLSSESLSWERINELAKKTGRCFFIVYPGEEFRSTQATLVELGFIECLPLQLELIPNIHSFSIRKAIQSGMVDGFREFLCPKVWKVINKRAKNEHQQIR